MSAGEGTSSRPNPLTSNAVFSVRHDGGEGGGNGGSRPPRRSGDLLLEMPRMGVKDPVGNPASRDRIVRENAELVLRELLPEGRVIAERVPDLLYVSDLLKAFGVTQHRFDIDSFRRGFALGTEHPERARQVGFDVDEVYLHWSLNTADLFRGGPERGAEALYHNTAPDLLSYEPFETAPGVKLNFFERVWFNGIQTLLGGRMRQNIQLHPGVRAFQLGMRLGLGEDLTMVTTGPAGRILILANEDPAMRMIYFGKTPNQSVSIEEVRSRPNIYTRESLVLAMRSAASGKVEAGSVPQLESYLRMVRENPGKGAKLKHPAIAGILGKRPFSILVDDSSSTFRLLSDLTGFTVLQPPSARPGTMLNFVLGSPQRYLDRMANGYVEELAQLLSGGPLSSTVLSPRSPAPENYPTQRFAIEIPWTRFGREFVAPARELKFLARHLRRFDVPALLEGEKTRNPEAAAESAPRPPVPPLHLSESQRAELNARLQWAFQAWTKATGVEVAAQSLDSTSLRDLALRSPAEFDSLLERHFTERERERLASTTPVAERPQKYFSRIAGMMAAKRSVFKILGMDLESPGNEIDVRFGPPGVEGETKRRLHERFGHLNTSMASDGSVGVGMAFFEQGIWDSGLVGFGLDLTTDRVRYTSPERHALAESAYKGVYRTHEIERFNHHRERELQLLPDGSYAITGKTMRAARVLRGDQDVEAPLPIHASHFRLGDATVALVGIPALRRGRVAPSEGRETEASLGPVSPMELKGGAANDFKANSANPPAPETSAEPAVVPSSEAELPSLEAWSREVGRLEELARLESGSEELPPHPLEENHRALVATGFFANEANLARSPTTLEIWEKQYLDRFNSRKVTLREYSDTPGARRASWFFGVPGDGLAVHFREFSWEGRPLLHLSEVHEVRGAEIPLHEEVRFRGAELNQSVHSAGGQEALGGRKILQQLLERINRAGAARPNTDFPYLVRKDGTFILPDPGMKVAVLGDVCGARTFQLAVDGHHAVHIDWDPQYLGFSQRGVSRYIKVLRGEGLFSGEPSIEWIQGDWFETQANADFVEAYFPLSISDLPRRGQEGREPALVNFLNRAVHTKLAPQGRGIFIISEQPDIVKDLAEIVRRDPRWELVEEEYMRHYQPLVGGHGGLSLDRAEGMSWILYRPASATLTSPYRLEGEGTFSLSSPPIQVAVLGDVGGVRTFELALQGHDVVHIDRDPEYLSEARRRVLALEEDARREGRLTNGFSVKFLQQDWNDVRLDADLVEAYYPLDFRDIPTRPGPARDQALQDFLGKTLNSKLGSGGIGGFMVSEHHDIIQDLARVIGGDPSLQVVDQGYDWNRPPLLGGYGILSMSTMRHSWLIYRRRPE